MTELACSPTVELGGVLELAFTVATPDDADLVIDYTIGFPGPTGRVGRKVYRLTRIRTTAGAPVMIRHHHPLHAGMTTRRIIPGRHHVELQINGQQRATASFTVTAPDMDASGRCAPR